MREKGKREKMRRTLREIENKRERKEREKDENIERDI